VRRDIRFYKVQVRKIDFLITIWDPETKIRLVRT